MSAAPHAGERVRVGGVSRRAVLQAGVDHGERAVDAPATSARDRARSRPPAGGEAQLAVARARDDALAGSVVRRRARATARGRRPRSRARAPRPRRASRRARSRAARRPSRRAGRGRRRSAAPAQRDPPPSEERAGPSTPSSASSSCSAIVSVTGACEWSAITITACSARNSLDAAGGVHHARELQVGLGDRLDLRVGPVLVRVPVVVRQRQQQEVEQVVLDQVGGHAAGVAVAHARHAQARAAAGAPRGEDVGVEQLARAHHRSGACSAEATRVSAVSRWGSWRWRPRYIR